MNNRVKKMTAIASFGAVSGLLYAYLKFSLPFFPSFLKNISKFLPFQYISDLSFRIYVGDIGIYNGLIGILTQIFWLILVIIIGYFLMKHNMKRVVVQGG